MADRAPGWYPAPERPSGLRWWNGSTWTDDEPAAPAVAEALPSTGAARRQKKWIVAGIAAGSVAVIALIVGATMAISAAFDGGDEARIVAESEAADEPMPTADEPQPAPAPPAPAEPEIIPLGATLTSENFALTIHSAEVVDSIDVLSGAPLTPSPGTQLVMIRSTYTVLGPNAVDLICGNYDVFIQAFDSAGNEMSDLYEEPRIAGNPTCNDHLVSGQSSEWNSAYQMTAGQTPEAFVVIDTNLYNNGTWSDDMVMALR